MMNELEIQEKNERIFKSSPFLYHKNMEFVTMNKNMNCTYAEITELIKSGKIIQSDLIVLDTLEIFQYLNRYCIETYIISEVSIPSKYKKRDYKKALQKMVKSGIILRHCFTWNEGKDIKNSSYFYSLSKGAHAYVSKYRRTTKKIEGKNDFSVPNTSMLLHLLILNQFHIHYMASYASYVRHAMFSQLLKIDNCHFMLDACYRMDCKKIRRGYIDIALIVIRRNPDWKNDFLEKLALLYAASEKHEDIDSPIMIILCEDIVQAKEAFLCQEQTDQVKNIQTYFTTDLQIVREPILDYLSECTLIPIDKTEQYSNGYDDGSPLRADNLSELKSSSLSSFLSVEIVTKKMNIF